MTPSFSYAIAIPRVLAGHRVISNADKWEDLQSTYIWNHQVSGHFEGILGSTQGLIDISLGARSYNY